MTSFVDTSVWYAAADSGDVANGRAREILGSGESLLTTDHILIETWTLLRFRVHRTAAEAFWAGLRSGVAKIEIVGAADLQAA